MKILSNAAEFVDWKNTPRVIGKFISTVIAEEDNERLERKKGDVMGYTLEEENGTFVIVGNSFLIEKSLSSEGCGIGSIVGITFKGKGETSSKQPFNRFEVIQFDDFAEANKYYDKAPAF
jgi:hypothetical protein